jgi:phage-related minor tail protein
MHPTDAAALPPPGTTREAAPAPADDLRRIAATLAATARRLDTASPTALDALRGSAVRLGDALAALPAGSPAAARLALLVLLAELQELTEGLALHQARLARRLGDVALGRAVAAAYRSTRRL